MGIRNPQSTKNLRRALRQDMTGAERILWEKVRRKQLGVRVKRQYGLGPYIIDFYIPKANLAIEIDGKIHLKTTVKQKDINKDAYLKRNGIHLIRFRNGEVENNLDLVLSTLNRLIDLHSHNK